MYEMRDESMMSGTVGDTAVEGGYLNILLHEKFVAKIYVPPNSSIMKIDNNSLKWDRATGGVF
jgi:hypothetical protein